MVIFKMKRKQPDDEERVGVLPRLNPLIQDHIENEYEHLDDDDDLEDDGEPRATILKKDEYEQIINAQQPMTVTREDDIEFTPFNLVDELEEGSFDKAGNFVFKKKDGEEQDEGGNDTWAESIDWAEVERMEKEKTEQQRGRSESSRAQESKSQVTMRDEQTCHKEMLRIMRPGETVQKTIRRLGNSIPRRRPFKRNARKTEQPGSSSEISNDQQAIEDAKRRLDLIIELADQRLRDGDMDIYQRSYDDLEDAIN